MFDTELLLSHTPEDAIVMMINAENGTHFPTGTFEFGLPEVIDGRHTRIHCKVRKPVHKQDEVPYDGEFDFEYYRLEMASHFADVLAGFQPTLPTSTQVVLNELKRRLKQDFYLDDVVLEEIGRTNAAPYRLKAKVESLRWVGELEIFLSDTQDLTEFFNVAILSNEATRMGKLDATPQLRSANILAPYVNGTHVKGTIAQIEPGNYAQDNPHLITVIQQAVPIPGQPINPATTPWHDSETPGPFNLHNARMLVLPYEAVDVHPSNERLTHVLDIVLDPAYTLAYNDTELRIPYRIDDFSESEFTQPRLSRYGVKSLTDGSAFGVWLNTIAANSTITTLAPAGGPFLINGPIAYVADPVVAGPRNLHGSIVMYNGQRRPQDSQPANPALNRVLVLNLTSLNTAYKGNFSIHYRAPIFLPDKLPNGFLNQAYSFALNATEGVGPYLYRLYEGAWAPGHSMDGTSGVISGSATANGLYKVGIEVEDSRGVIVRYQYAYEVKIADLLVVGSAPDAKVGLPYHFAYTITGGVAPYVVQMVSGSVPPSIQWNAAIATLDSADVLDTSIGDYSWTIAVRDARGTVEIRRFDAIKVEA